MNQELGIYLLRKFRIENRMSLESLATRSRISKSYLSKIETGKRQPSREVIKQIGSSLELSVYDYNLLIESYGYSPKEIGLVDGIERDTFNTLVDVNRLLSNPQLSHGEIEELISNIRDVIKKYK